MASVTVSGIEKRFGTTVVLDGVSLEVPDGAFAVLVGPSGCGKSTLLRLLAGLERADAGTIRFGERDVSALEPRERDIAMVFQSYALYPHLSVRDNLAFGLRLRKTPRDELDRRVREVSEMLGLEKLLDRMPRALSGGQRQRVAMGRAIARRPQLFLFDEPLSNLDASLRSAVRVEIRRLHMQLGTTSVYVTHDQVEAMTLADVMFVLNKGRIEQQGAPLEIYERPATRFVAGFLGSPSMNFVEAVARRGGDGWSAELPGGASAIALGGAATASEALEEGRAVIVGVRPHDFDVVGAEPAAGDVAPSYRSPGASSALRLNIVLCEALGGESYAHATIGDQPVVVRLGPSVRVAPGDELCVQPTVVHLFDAASGRSLATDRGGG